MPATYPTDDAMAHQPPSTFEILKFMLAVFPEYLFVKVGSPSHAQDIPDSSRLKQWKESKCSAIHLMQYIDRIFRSAEIDPDTYEVRFFILKDIIKLINKFLNKTVSHIVRDEYHQLIRRLFLICFTLSCKFYLDRHPSNRHMSTVGGLPGNEGLRKINDLERELLFNIFQCRLNTTNDDTSLDYFNKHFAPLFSFFYFEEDQGPSTIRINATHALTESSREMCELQQALYDARKFLQNDVNPKRVKIYYDLQEALCKARKFLDEQRYWLRCIRNLHIIPPVQTMMERINALIQVKVHTVSVMEKYIQELTQYLSSSERNTLCAEDCGKFFDKMKKTILHTQDNIDRWRKLLQPSCCQALHSHCAFM